MKKIVKKWFDGQARYVREYSDTGILIGSECIPYRYSKENEPTCADTTTAEEVAKHELDKISNALGVYPITFGRQTAINTYLELEAMKHNISLGLVPRYSGNRSKLKSLYLKLLKLLID